MEIAETPLFPVLLPHFDIGPEGLYLGESLVCQLSQEEKIYCKLCDGQHSLDQILKGLPTIDPPEEVLPYMLQLQAPIGNRRNESKDAERILIISPNPESAFLAMGGSLSMNENATMRLLVCFKQQEQTHLPEVFSNRTETSAVRNDEAHWAAQICGIELRGLNYPEFSLRRQSEGFSPDSEMQIAGALKAAILTEIDDFRPSRIYAPAAIGEHPDHMMVHQMTIDIFKRAMFPDTRYLLYREYPYALNYGKIDEALTRMEATYISVKERFVTLSEKAIKQEVFMDLFFSLYDPTEISLLNHIQKRINVEANVPQQGELSSMEAFFEIFSVDY